MDNNNPADPNAPVDPNAGQQPADAPMGGSVYTPPAAPVEPVVPPAETPDVPTEQPGNDAPVV